MVWHVYFCSIIMQTDIIIVGQGISGTMLSWFLHKEGKRFVVVDNNAAFASSKVAAGIINPVTGRRYVYSWMIDTLMPFAYDTYTQMGNYLGIEVIRQKSVIDFFASPQMLDAFATRLTENDTFLHTYPDQNHFNQFFNHPFGCGEIRPAYVTNLSLLLSSWRQRLTELNCLREETFDAQVLSVISDGVQWGDITAQQLIFCDGATAIENRWFNLLPFSLNKGEALFIESEGLTNEHIFKIGMLLAPLAQKNLFWVGSNYQLQYEDEKPSEAFYTKTKAHLEQWLKVPFKIVDHKAAVRPATIERRPFVGFHPLHNNVGILNGMGTKGTSLAPFFAHQLVQHLVYGFPITPEADVKRFSRILSK